MTSHERRQGHFTSHELPRGMSAIPYDIPGDPGLARAIAHQAEGRDDIWILACDDPYLPIFYGTINVWTFLGDPGTAWISVAVNQTCTTEDFLLFGELIGNAIAGLDRRVVLLASGGMTHRFFRFRELRQHEASDPSRNRKHAPEGKFGHYLMMAAAIGGARCQAPGELFSEYEASVGTGQVHVWFERPGDGWTGEGAAA